MSRVLLWILAGTTALAIAIALEISFFSLKPLTSTGELLFLVLFNLNLMALLALGVYVGRTLIGLAHEFRARTLGYKFKTRLMAFFLILTSIPSALLFLVASGLGSNYIDRLFTPDFSRPIENAVQIARNYYETERMKTLEFAELARAGHEPPAHYRVRFVRAPLEESSASIEAAFEGRHEAEVISSDDGVLIRAAIPWGPEATESGVLIVETSVPPDVRARIDEIQNTYEDYLKLESWKSPLKLNYLMLLGFFTLVIIFSALWAALKIAGWITEPVKRLAGATEAVAAGNLSVSVASARRDEMGQLIESFNRMVAELREGKESLQRLFLESDRRRIAMENIVANIQSGVISLDAQGRVLAINAPACHMLGVSEDMVVGKFYTAALSGIQSEELRQFIKSINIKTFKAAEKELRVQLGGTERLLRVSITGLHGTSGQYLGLLVVLSDITDVSKAQRAMAWQEVARRMAHEIKNPLTPIKLSAERMLKKGAGDDPDFPGVLERSMQTIIREVEALKDMVDEFSRLGKMPSVELKPMSVAPVVEEAVSLYGNYKNVEIVVSSPDDLPLVAIDREQFKRVMLNLLDNALRAVENRGRIEVRILPTPEEGKLLIEVADEGPGIAEEDREHLFVPYFSTNKDGTGLGLAIADRIVAEHGGRITVRDNIPRGSVFTIEVPIKEA